jgi:putative CocE/NonD family hydrolase
MNGSNMNENVSTHSPFRVDVVGAMTIEWDVPIEMSDGIVLRADIFRPTAPGEYPVVLSYGPYGKGKPFQRLLSGAWDMMIADHPDVIEESSGAYQNYELVDPEKWVPDGYVCMRVDSRGTGRSPGYLDPFGDNEIRDLYHCIEWAANRSWSNGRVGLNGISYYAINQWRVAALQPPHLAAICVWEGAGDWYRDITYHGGTLSTFVDHWYALLGQHGLGEEGGRNPHTGQLICGDETFTEEELARRRVDLGSVVRAHPLLDDYHRDHTPDWSQITVPLLSAGNWGGLGLHLRGNTRGFELAASAEEWLELHNEAHWSLFYAKHGQELQKRFFGHFLKGEDTGWGNQPRVQLLTRRADGSTGLRTASAWPLPETEWTRLYLRCDDASMSPAAASTEASLSYDARHGRVSFTWVCPQEVELAGPLAAKLYVESSTVDADIFVVVRAFSPDGVEVVFQGANDPHTPITQGWLRASHRTLDADQSRPFLPVHRHDRPAALTLGAVYELDVEIWPTSLILPRGYALTLDVQGHDYVYPGAATAQPGFAAPFTGSGPFLHNDERDRPAEIYAGTVTVHSSADRPSQLLLPVIPASG